MRRCGDARAAGRRGGRRRRPLTGSPGRRRTHGRTLFARRRPGDRCVGSARALQLAVAPGVVDAERDRLVGREIRVERTWVAPGAIGASPSSASSIPPRRGQMARQVRERLSMCRRHPRPRLSCRERTMSRGGRFGGGRLTPVPFERAALEPGRQSGSCLFPADAQDVVLQLGRGAAVTRRPRKERTSGRQAASLAASPRRSRWRRRSASARSKAGRQLSGRAALRSARS